MPPKKTTTGKTSAAAAKPKFTYQYAWLTQQEPYSTRVRALVNPAGKQLDNFATSSVQEFLDAGWSALEYKGFGLLMSMKTPIEDEE